MAEENIIEYKDGILTNPILEGVEITSFKRIKNGLDAIHITVTMFTTDAVQLSLKLHWRGFLLVEKDLTLTGIVL